jgi:vancomycin resistance protein VanW
MMQVLELKYSNSIMNILKHIFPAKVKLRLRVLLWRCRDFFSGQKFTVRTETGTMMNTAVTITQPVLTTPSAANKIHNILLALKKLNGLVIAPGETFSFWRLVGNPSQKNGYQKSRSIVGGQLVAETGGGLCQLSGLIYFLAIKAGVQITERHAHSVDIYTEAERFTPLGSDATVAYGYKDLRFTNNLLHPIGLQFTLTANALTGCITSQTPVSATDIRFEYRTENEIVEITTMAGSNVLCKNTCRRLTPVT